METDEELEDGYGADTPAGDNLCNDFVQGMADAYLTLAAARGERVVDDDPDVAMADGASPSLFGNVAIMRRPLRDDAWGDVAERMHGFFDGRPGGGYLVFSAWPTPDMRRADFGQVGHPPLLVRAPGPVDDRPVDGLDVRPVTDEASALDWERTFVDGYPEPDLQPHQPGCLLPTEALGAPGWQHWVGYLDGEPVATSSAFVGDHHVDVEFVATLPSARGRGIGRVLTATASLAAPDLPAMLISSDDGRGVYEGLGYVPLLRFTLWAGHRR